EFQVYTKVLIPQLNPVTVSTAIILGHVSLKIFDLIFAMTGVGPGFATDVPGIFVFEQTFKATRYNLGAAASIVMLLLVSLIIVPLPVEKPSETLIMSARPFSFGLRAGLPAKPRDFLILGFLVLCLLFFSMPLYVMIVTGLKEATSVSLSTMWNL